MPIKIVAICGSVRPGNYTMRAMNLAVDELFQQTDVSVTSLTLDHLDLPLPGLPAKNPTARDEFVRTVKDATGLLLASPEYHGGISSPMKLAIDNLGFPSVLAGKPVSLLGVAAGVIGAVKSLEQLRGICSHVGAIVLPMAVSVARVQAIFDEEGRCKEPATEKYIRASATNLIDYIRGAICPRITLEAMARGESPGSASK